MSLILRGGSELSPAEFGGPQTGGIMVQGGRRGRSGKRSGSKRSGSKRRGSRKLRGGNNCQMKAGMNPMGMSGGVGVMAPPGGGGRKSRSRSRSSLRKPLVLPRYGGGGRTRRLRKHSGKARRHRTKSYSA